MLITKGMSNSSSTNGSKKMRRRRLDCGQRPTRASLPLLLSLLAVSYC